MGKEKVFGMLLAGLPGGWIVSDWRVLTPEIDLSKCTKCWICHDFCPEKAVEKTDEGARIDLRFCKGCGICANECPLGAIKMVKEQ